MRAIGYYSTQNENIDPDNLFLEFEQYCKLGHHDYDEYSPYGIFLDQNFKNPNSEYDRMKKFLEDSKDTFMIFIPDVTHFGNSLESAVRKILDCDKTGSKVRCMDNECPDPIQNALKFFPVSGKKSSSGSTKIKKSLQKKASQAQALGRPPYGYKISDQKKLQIVAEEAKVVELIYRLYTSDKLGLRLIAKHLNDRNIFTKKGRNWNVVTIRDILRNSAYIGTYSRFGMKMPLQHTPIISEELFRQARDQTWQRRPIGRISESKPFLLSGLVFCASCGNKMMGATKKQSWKLKNGNRSYKTYRYYQCQSRNNQSVCSYHTWRSSRLETTVLDQLKLALSPRIMDLEKREFRNMDAVKSIWNDRIETAQRRFFQSVRRTANGEMTLQIMGEYLNQLDNAKLGLNHSINSSDITQIFTDWDSLDVEYRQIFLKENIQKILVTDESVELKI